MADIKITTGAVRYSIKDEFGDEIGVIKFVPTDLDIIKRYDEVKAFLMEERTTNTEEELLAFSDQLIDKFDYLLKTNTRDTLFKVTNPMTPLADGTLYFASVFTAIQQVVEKETKKRTEKFQNALRDITGE